MKIKFVIQDMWVGLYWRTEESFEGIWPGFRTTYYLCIIPCFPIIWETYEFRGPHEQ